MTTQQNYDPEEIAKFSAIADQWWDPQGPFKTLHDITPLRLGFIQEQTTLQGKACLDVGCGGGLLSEAMAEQQAQVTALDLDSVAIDAAKTHLQQQDFNVDYKQCAVEELAATQPGSFDNVICMEMLEHVPDPQAIIQACSELTKPGGKCFFSTLNRNPKAYGLAILGAEYILQLLPKGTHDYQKFIKPSELEQWCRDANLRLIHMQGLSYNPFKQQYRLCTDVSVNYLVCCEKG